jgi:excisionase family DNA binding protein
MPEGYMPEQMKKMLSIGEAAARLHVSQNTLRKWSDEGRVPTVRRPGGGGLRRYDPNVIERIRREMGYEED